VGANAYAPPVGPSFTGTGETFTYVQVINSGGCYDFVCLETQNNFNF
jgi:hypothetical protein